MAASARVSVRARQAWSFATLAAAVVAEPLDVAFAALTLRLRGGRGLDVVRALGPVALASIPLYSPIVALLGVAYRATFAVDTRAVLRSSSCGAKRCSLYTKASENWPRDSQEIERSTRSEQISLLLQPSIATLDARDRYTAGHSAAVSIYARDIARRMGLADEQQQLAHLAGWSTTSERSACRPGLLEKPGALTLDERRDMQRHSEIGERILANVETYAEIAASRPASPRAR